MRIFDALAEWRVAKSRYAPYVLATPSLRARRRTGSGSLCGPPLTEAAAPIFLLPVALLRVIPFELFARLADLLDDEEVWMLSYDALDLAVLVARDDHEMEAFVDDALVVLRGDGDSLHA